MDGELIEAEFMDVEGDFIEDNVSRRVQLYGSLTSREVQLVTCCYSCQWWEALAHESILVVVTAPRYDQVGSSGSMVLASTTTTVLHTVLDA